MARKRFFYLTEFPRGEYFELNSLKFQSFFAIYHRRSDFNREKNRE